MIERVEIVEYGRAAAEALAAVVSAAKGGSALAPVTVVVPSNLAGLTARRLLGSGVLGLGGIANVGFVTPFRLAELVGADLLLDSTALTNPVLGAAVRRALAEDPGPFGAVAQHHATEATLASLYAEMSNVSADVLVRLERYGGAAADAVALVRRIGSHLDAFHGEADLALAAASRQDLPAALAPSGHLVWYLPQPVTAPLSVFLAAAFAAVPSSVVVGLTGHADADREVIDTCRKVGASVAPPAEGSGTAPPVGSVIVSVTDADEEVRAVVRRIADLVESGVRLDRIAIFYPTPEPYVAMIEQHLGAADISCNGPSRRRLADLVAGRTLLGALALPSQRWRRDRVMALVSGAPVRQADGPAHPAAWEMLSRSAGVVQDRSDWRSKLDAHAHLTQRRCADARAAGSVGLAARLDSDVAALAELQQFVDWLVTGVGAVERATGWSAKSAAAAELLAHLLGGHNQRANWPEAEQTAFERVEDALVRLAALEEIEASPSHAVFVRALTAELTVSHSRVNRFGQGVLYGPLASAVGCDVDVVFVLGCREGLCPVPRRDDALLPDAARSLTDGGLPLRAERLHQQHRAFLAALAAAPADGRVLLFPRGDLRSGRTATPSRWLLETATALHCAPVRTTDFELWSQHASHTHASVEHVASHATALVGSPTHANVDERDLSQLGALSGVSAVLAHPASARVRRGLTAQLARSSGDFTEWDGNVEGQPVRASHGKPLSPTRLETWAACGMRYFLGYVLGLAERDDPERVTDISALDKGSAIHEILERFLGEAIVAGAPEPDEPWSEAHHRRLQEVAVEVLDDYDARGRTGRPVYWRLTRAEVAAMLDQFLLTDNAHRSATQSVPIHVELPFGLDGWDPVRFELPDGRRMEFQGRADRVDRDQFGHLLVTDYKTGKGAKYDKLGNDDVDPVQQGTTLQLGLYAEAALQHLGAAAAASHYWRVELRSSSARVGYRWTPETKDRFLEVLAAIADGIEAGVFPMNPGEWDSFRGTHAMCVYCKFDPVCPRDRGEHAESKVAAPQLRVRSILTEAAP